MNAQLLERKAAFAEEFEELHTSTQEQMAAAIEAFEEKYAEAVESLSAREGLGSTNPRNPSHFDGIESGRHSRSGSIGAKTGFQVLNYGN